jgi:hypothetical protein
VVYISNGLISKIIRNTVKEEPKELHW